jgi:hypothetical protein
MNLLEQYIEEVHSIEPYTEEWTKKFDKDFVIVDVTTNCYGSKKRDKHIWTVKEWRNISAQGYYMG